MQILLTSPYAHPHVWRGAERYVSEFGAWLAGRGHDVVHVATGPRREQLRTPDGVTVSYHPTAARPLTIAGRRLATPLGRTAVPIARAVRRLHPDVAQCHGWPDGFALKITRRHPYVYWLPGVPRRASMRLPVDRWIAESGVRGADVVFALSKYAGDVLAEEFGVPSQVMYPGVDTSIYRGERPALDHPVVLTTAAADDPRKRIGVLVDAFCLLAGRMPDVRLVLVQPRPEAAERLIAGLPEQVRRRCEIRTGLDADAIAAAYRGATVSVLPSVDEAFGLVNVESLASGTPVVGSRHGALPEIIDDGRTGVLVPPDDIEALADGLARGIALSLQPGTSDRCRQAAQDWDWVTVGPRHEAVYRDLVG